MMDRLFGPPSRSKLFNSAIPVFARSFALGWTASTLSTTLVAPYQRVSEILRVQAKHPDIPSELRFGGVMDCFRHLWVSGSERTTSQRVLSFWRGNWSGEILNARRIGRLSACCFGCRALFMKYLLPESRMGELPPSSQIARLFCVGGLAGFGGLAVAMPWHFARELVSAAPQRYRGIVDCLRVQARSGGLRAIYPGFRRALACFVPYQALYFGLYDTGKKLSGSDASQSFWFRSILAYSTTVLSQVAVQPISSVLIHRELIHSQQRNYFDSIIEIAKDRGLGGFFRGVRVVFVDSLGPALCLALYDSIGQFLFLDTREYGRRY